MTVHKKQNHATMGVRGRQYLSNLGRFLPVFKSLIGFRFFAVVITLLASHSYYVSIPDRVLEFLGLPGSETFEIYQYAVFLDYMQYCTADVT